MRQMIEKILAYYADDCSVETADGTKAVRAFIQPVRNHAKGDFLRQMHALGELPEGRYIYIGPTAAIPVDGGSALRGGREFIFCRVETLYAENEPVYVWGLLRESGGDADAEAD